MVHLYSWGDFCANMFRIQTGLWARSLLVTTISTAIGRLLVRPQDLLGYNSTAQDAEVAPLSSQKQLGCSVYNKHTIFKSLTCTFRKPSEGPVSTNPEIISVTAAGSVPEGGLRSFWALGVNLEVSWDAARVGRGGPSAASLEEVTSRSLSSGHSHPSQLMEVMENSL